MTPFSSRRLAVLFAPLLLTAPAAAQFMPQPTPNADRLAEQMRVLAANPRDVYALIEAGELSTRLEDAPAAMAFFARASAVDPGNPRIAAGRAGAFVLLERPGEALRLYAQAERAGVAMTPYLLQRGLAYDLTGQPGHAQRDYRAVLARGADDEATRRLALSLGIVGRRDEALAVLDPLLRRSDRAAWRARACILALGGDPAGAEKIAANMMQGGQALGPFLRRLPALSIADRAFAVHFGDLVPTAARQTDARLAPAVAPLPTDAPVVLASAVPVARPATSRRERTQSRASQPVDFRVLRSRAARAVPRQASAPATAVAAAIVPRPQPPATAAPAPGPSPVQQPQAAVTPTPTPPPVATLPPAAQPSAAPTPEPITPTPAPVPTQLARPEPSPPPYQVFTPPTRSIAPQPIPMGEAAAPPPATSVLSAAVASSTAAVAAVPPPASPVAVTPTPTPTPVATNWAASADPVQIPAPPPVQAAAMALPATPPPAVPPRAGLDSIIGTIAIPAEELEVRPVRVSAPAARPEVKKPVLAAAKPEPKKVKPDPVKLEPARWWAQVAGGARVADLDRDWKRLAAKSPTAFRGKAAWTTPLRATNRLLAGPFKSQGEAQGFVNAIGKDGLSAFAWQSEAGQAITRLALD